MCLLRYCRLPTGHLVDRDAHLLFYAGEVSVPDCFVVIGLCAIGQTCKQYIESVLVLFFKITPFRFSRTQSKNDKGILSRLRLCDLRFQFFRRTVIQPPVRLRTVGFLFLIDLPPCLLGENLLSDIGAPRSRMLNAIDKPKPVGRVKLTNCLDVPVPIVHRTI